MKAFNEQGANIDDASIQEQTGKDEISTMKDDREIVKEVNAKQQENQEKEEKEIKEEDIKKK